MAQITIGPMRYDVSLVDAFPDDSDDREYLGQIDYGSVVIRVKRDMPQDQRRVTLWHEILHALFKQAGLGEMKAEEQVVTALSFALNRMNQRPPFFTRGLWFASEGGFERWIRFCVGSLEIYVSIWLMPHEYYGRYVNDQKPCCYNCRFWGGGVCWGWCPTCRKWDSEGTYDSEKTKEEGLEHANNSVETNTLPDFVCLRWQPEKEEGE